MFLLPSQIHSAQGDIHGIRPLRPWDNKPVTVRIRHLPGRSGSGMGIQSNVHYIPLHGNFRIQIPVVMGIQFKMHEKVAILVNPLGHQIHFLLFYGAVFLAAGHDANSRQKKGQPGGMEYSVHGHSLLSPIHSYREKGEARKNGRKAE
jgi:hypothetical protein